jgi:hypothetical protein
VDIQHRYSEKTSYTLSRDSEGFVNTIVTPLSLSVSKTWTFARNPEGLVATVNIHMSDNSYDKTYTFNRDLNGLVTNIVIS